MSRQVVLSIILGIAFRVGQPVEHPPCGFPANVSVCPKVPHGISGLLEFREDLADESLPATGVHPSFSLFARDIDPESENFGYSEFHFPHWFLP
jgi:hypothetical protein